MQPPGASRTDPEAVTGPARFQFRTLDAISALSISVRLTDAALQNLPEAPRKFTALPRKPAMRATRE
eukprot:3839045-Alexandrium_andersonii.AAC.1